MKFSQSGHVLLYTTVFIPLALGGLSLAFDLSGVNLRSERLQSELDSIVLDATHFLPDTELAKSKTLTRLSLLTSEIINPEVSVNDENSRLKVNVTLTGTNYLLPKLLGVLGIELKTQVAKLVSEAEMLPLDIAVILSDGVDERPWNDGMDRTPWPTISGLGQPSSALTGCIQPPSKRYSNVEVQNVWQDSKEWLTQSCFNSVFTQFKLAAMNITGATLAVRTNRAAVVFTPGINGLGEVVRHCVPPLSPDGVPSGFLSSGQVPLASWTPAQDLEYELGDEACIVFSDTATASLGEYALDRLTPRDSNQRGCTTPILTPMCGQPFAIGQQGRLDQNCLARSSLSESIYWRSAKRPTQNFNATPDIYSALALALTEVLSSTEQIKLDHKFRGNLADNPGRVIILLTSVLPPLDISNSAIQGLIKTDTTLVVAFLERSDYPTPLIDPQIQSIRVKEWESFLNDQAATARIRSKLYLAKSLVELNQNIVPKILSTSRRVLLRR